jgi:hypothetical protein
MEKNGNKTLSHKKEIEFEISHEDTKSQSKFSILDTRYSTSIKNRETRNEF